jgi:Dipeptidyl peptidase IV (DPP IV) N-terminal region
MSPRALTDAGSGSDTVSFLWASERSGFQQLYLYQVVPSTLFSDEALLASGDVGESVVDGAAVLVKQLTGGNFHIYDIIRVDEKHGWVYFDANVGSPLYHQLCRVKLRATPSPFEITHQPDSENVAFVPSVAEV